MSLPPSDHPSVSPAKPIAFGTPNYFSIQALRSDLPGSLVVFLVALPLCLGIAVASGTSAMSGLLAGIIGGIVVGIFSGSNTSVSGPAAGLTAIVVDRMIVHGGVFEIFLLGVVIAGMIQIGLGLVKAGALSAFFPSSVIKGLLAAIGILLILKQIPHLVGHDADPEGDMSFVQPDHENTISELLSVLGGEVQIGAALVGGITLILLLLWNRIELLKRSPIPGPLVVVLSGVGLHLLLLRIGGQYAIETSHLVDLPVPESAADFFSDFKFPQFSALANPAVYVTAMTIAIVASLETLLNLEAVDKIDTRRRHSPPSRELVAQGIGNICGGMIGALPVTSVIVRSSVNVNVGSRTKMAAIYHGFLLLISVAMLPSYLNLIPKAALASILIVTGFKLASATLFRQMWRDGRYQFIPFIVTLGSILVTDLLIGILIGLAVSAPFILNSNLRRPIRQIVETHITGKVLRIELAQQVSFLNRATLSKLFESSKPGDHVLVDASDSDYIDPDIQGLIRDFKSDSKKRGVKVSLKGFRSKYDIKDDIHYADFASRELKELVSPSQVLDILRAGNERFYNGKRLHRNLMSAAKDISVQPHPLAVVVSCIDSRTPAELVFDVGVGDIYSVRVAGNVIGTKTLASVDYGVGISNVKLVVVLGHTRCNAILQMMNVIAAESGGQSEPEHSHRTVQSTSGQTLQVDWTNLGSIASEVYQSIDPEDLSSICNRLRSEQPLNQVDDGILDRVTRSNVLRTVDLIRSRSTVVANAVAEQRVLLVGAIYDVDSGKIEFLEESADDAAG